MTPNLPPQSERLLAYVLGGLTGFAAFLFDAYPVVGLSVYLTAGAAVYADRRLSRTVLSE